MSFGHGKSNENGKDLMHSRYSFDQQFHLFLFLSLVGSRAHTSLLFTTSFLITITYKFQIHPLYQRDIYLYVVHNR